MSFVFSVFPIERKKYTHWQKRTMACGKNKSNLSPNSTLEKAYMA
jgi:hypothetical protein